MFGIQRLIRLFGFGKMEDADVHSAADAASGDDAIPAKKAARMIRSGRSPAAPIRGTVKLAGELKLTELPNGIRAHCLDLTGCRNLTRLPADLRVRRLTLRGDWNPQHLLGGLDCFDLDLGDTHVEVVSQLRVRNRLILEGCVRLRSLPENLRVGALNLRGCTALESLPEGLEAAFLDISGCARLRAWPRRAHVGPGRFVARDCTQITELPPWLTRVSQLDVRGCRNLRELPDSLVVGSWIDLADTGIREIPESSRGARLRWRGVVIDERIAFQPESITASEVLAESNAERRRVLIERMGYQRFLDDAKAQVLDSDSDAGGERRLLRVPLERDEDVVCVSLVCPSTGRRYVIRVPPTTTSCRQAVAWMAGFDNPDNYRPLVET